MSETSTSATKTISVKKRSPKKLAAIIGIVVLIIALWFGYRWLTEWRFMVTTDDAYVQGDIATIAPKVNGYIDDIPVETNHPVKKGDILFRLDDGDYKIAFDEAEAKLATQNRTLARIEAQIEAAKTSLDEANAQKDAAKAVLTNADITLKRAKELNVGSFVAKSAVDNAQSAYDQAVANVTRADAQIAAAAANIAVLEAQHDESVSETKSLELARDKARRDLDFTVLRAPFDGVIGNLAGKKGDFVVNGQRLAALVPVNALYIDANYKETQLPSIYGGEKVHISVDGLDGETFEGTVLSLSPASGAVFSLLPPQNATGNFTKIVQRVPVRISIPEDVLATGRIRAGMSVIVSVDTRTKPEGAKPLANK
ncbi:HlyD family secretion protein [uncultured Bartonella sp.]|uniref:HlyD family secretion protein n=1 Tax=uncultured Bartonella sp. TaxID=104108 RepID=UPI00262932AE|nr:HlyD family secretion protein [uncultured Bartonella sp.]